MHLKQPIYFYSDDRKILDRKNVSAMTTVAKPTRQLGFAMQI